MRKIDDRFKASPSQLGRLMTNGRGKNAVMGQTAIAYVQETFISQLYGKKREVTSKYMTKGNVREDDSIDFISDAYGGFLTKNEQFFENHHFKGTPDIVTPNLIIDIKNSWDAFTFPLMDEEVPKKDYYYQLQAYMDLTGVNKAELVYTLMNATDDEIEAKAYQFAKSNGYDEVEQWMYEKMQANYTYDDLPYELRVKKFAFDRDDEFIEKAKERIDYVNDTIWKDLINKYKHLI